MLHAVHYEQRSVYAACAQVVDHILRLTISGPLYHYSQIVCEYINTINEINNHLHIYRDALMYNIETGSELPDGNNYRENTWELSF